MKSKRLFFIFISLFPFIIMPPLRYFTPLGAQNNNRGIGLKTGSHGEQRVALVIGNSNYETSPLLNSINDARDMAQTLRDLSFEVIYGENLSQNDIRRNIRVFGDRISNGGVGLFYYAGHGIQINGKNFLIPVGATITKEEEVEYESVNVGLVLAQMEHARNRLNIVILDACRNNPFARSRSFRSTNDGLAPIEAPSGTLIAYATAPGSVASDGHGRNGLYTQELLKYMRTPNLSIEQVFKQVRIAVSDQTKGKQIPWELSSLVGEFYFSVTSETSTPDTSFNESNKPNESEAEWMANLHNSTHCYSDSYPADLTNAQKNALRTFRLNTLEVKHGDEGIVFILRDSFFQSPFSVLLSQEGVQKLKLLARYLNSSPKKYASVRMSYCDCAPCRQETIRSQLILEGVDGSRIGGGVGTAKYGDYSVGRISCCVMVIVSNRRIM